jgi:sugar phosphate isomerase/epimerase
MLADCARFYRQPVGGTPQSWECDLRRKRRVEAREVPWGEGVGDIQGILQEVRRQKIPAVFNVEYERPGDTRPEIARSLAFFARVAARLAP